MSITFEQMPEVLGQILSRLDMIERGITSRPAGSTGDPAQPMTVDQAAVFLGLSKPTIYAYVSAGKIPYMKQARKLYFSKADLSQWLRSGSGMTYNAASTMANHHLAKAKQTKQR